MRSGGLWPKLLACVIFLLCGTGARAVPLETAATPGRAQLPYQTGRPRCSGQSHVHGRIITANVSDAKQMVDYLAVADATVLAVQEHRTGADQLADVQARARDKGWSGAWIPGVATEAGGTSGGLAILTRGKAMITVPPGKDSHVLVDGRAMAARVHWGCPGGLVFVNLYLVVGEGPSECNCSILHDVALYLAEVNSRGFDWIVCGDFNMEYDSLPDLEWLHNLGGGRDATPLDYLPPVHAWQLHRLLPRVGERGHAVAGAHDYRGRCHLPARARSLAFAREGQPHARQGAR